MESKDYERELADMYWRLCETRKRYAMIPRIVRLAYCHDDTLMTWKVRLRIHIVRFILRFL